MADEPLVDVRDLHLSFGRRRVLKGVAARFSRGESVLIAGKNGTGKTTFLRCLAGVLRPDRGRVSWAPDVPPKKIGFVSESLSFYEDWSVEQGIAFHRRVFGLPGFDDRLLKRLSLKSGRRVKELSRGERVIFVFSLAISQQPRILLVDEVLNHMDAYLRELMLEALIEAIDTLGTTVLLINHTFQEAARLPERILFMSDGRFTIDEKCEALQANVKKVVAGAPPPPDIPVLFRREGEYFKEYVVYPFREEMRGRLQGEVQDLGLPEILKAFIGGSYVAS